MKRKARNLGLGGMAILTGAVPVSAYAACSATAPGSGTTVTCTGANAPSVVATAGSTGVTINLDSTVTGSYVLTSTPTPFSVDASSTITTTAACRCPATARASRTAARCCSA